MVRNGLASLLAAAFLISPFHAVVNAQEKDEAWRNLMTHALLAAGKNDYAKSEQIFQDALKEAQRLGAQDVRIGLTFNNLGLVYKAQKKYADASAAFQRALPTLEKTYGADSIDCANVNFNLAASMAELGKPGAELPYLDRSLAIYRKQLGNRSVRVASVFCMIGDSYRASKKWQEAETSLHQCAEILEETGGVMNGELADALYSLAMVYQNEGKYTLADPQFALAEKIREKTLGKMSPALAAILETHSGMLRAMGRAAEADKDAALAGEIRRHEQNGR